MTNLKDRKERTGIYSGAIDNAKEYAKKVKYHGTRGHGFAAEDANHLDDVLSGKNAKIVGDDNVKNGADRLVNGQEIQTKYCKSGSKCISECFENSEFRYFDKFGEPMQIEVPKDKYDDAIKALRGDYSSTLIRRCV